MRDKTNAVSLGCPECEEPGHGGMQTTGKRTLSLLSCRVCVCVRATGVEVPEKVRDMDPLEMEFQVVVSCLV